MNELDFNIGKSRTEFIAELVNGATNTFIIAKLKPKEKNIYRYYTYLKALHIELETYVAEDESDKELEDNDEINKISEVFEDVEETIKDQGWEPEGSRSLHNVDAYENVLDKLIEVQKTLSVVRKEIGLDIPASDEIDPEDAGVDGLD